MVINTNDLHLNHNVRVSSDISVNTVVRASNLDGLKSKNVSSVRNNANNYEIGVGKAYDSMLSMFDEFVAGGVVGSVAVRSSEAVGCGHEIGDTAGSVASGSSEAVGCGHEIGDMVGSVAIDSSEAVGCGYEIGDMVWGKVKSHPWWPGQIYSEEFASPSVRRLKREDYVLVAFFGDNSFKWFDPAELISFESHYEEKSRLIVSKHFIKAVGEAVDEVSRRRGLGLECRCRNAYNFRPTEVDGYFAVDVGDYEGGAVYSNTQIKKARDSFQPKQVLDFIKQVALAPTRLELGSINFIKNKATVLAYRKAVFEEYDETYAQAFGYEPVHPSLRLSQENATGTISSRAPLSGRLVIAESLGKRKSSGRPSKVKDHSKKDKYLFKRRDESKELMVEPKKEGQQTFSLQPVYIEGSLATGAGDYMLQKRASEVSAKPEQTGTHSDFRDLAGEDVSSVGKPSASLQDNLGVRKTESVAVKMATTEMHELSQLKDGHSENGSEKVKVHKRSSGDLSSDKTVLVEKKRKKDSLKSNIVDTPVKDVGPVVSKKDLKSSGVSLKENSKVDHRSPEVRARTSDTNREGKIELEIPQILSVLQTLAVDPLYESDRGIPQIARRVFLKYRSLVYLKSLTVPQLTGDEVNKAGPIKSPAISEASDCPSSEDVKKQLQPRPSIRPDDPTKGGKKRGFSNHQEEIVVKKKKVNDTRNLTVEKKVVQKIPEAARAETRPAVASVPKKVVQESIKRIEQSPPAQASVPTMLMMKFSPGAKIPSINELKARFSRFGPDISAIRSFWKSSTCRLVFKDRKNADAAYNFLKTNRIFGEVNAYLKDVDVAAAAETEQAKVQTDEAVSTRLQPAGKPRPMTPGMQQQQQLKSILKKARGEEVASGCNGGGTPPLRVKFLLGEEESRNREEGGEMIGNKNNFTNNATISFADGGASFNSKNFQKPHVLSPILPLPIPSFPITATTSHGQSVRPQNPMQYSSELIVTPQLKKLPPQLPPPPPPPRNAHHNHNMSMFGPSTPNVDIGLQLLSLLRECEHIVTTVSNFLGYKPFHPL